MHKYVKSEFYPILLIFILISSAISYGSEYLYTFNILLFILVFVFNYFFKSKICRKKFVIIIIIQLIFLINILINKNVFYDDRKICEVINNTKKEYIITYSKVNKLKNSDDFFHAGIIDHSQPFLNYLVGKKIIIKDLKLKNILMSNNKVIGKIDFLDYNKDFVLIDNVRSYKENKYKYKHLSKQRKYFVNISNNKSIAFGWAMLTGSKEFIKEEQLIDFFKTGTMHLFAVSGLHLGFFYLLISFLLKPLNLRSNIVFLIKFSICTFYLFLINFPISAVRAFIMISIYESCNFVDYKQKRINFFNLSMILIIFYDFMVVFSLSAQLSFTVVLFILFNMLNKKYSSSLLNRFRSFLIFSLSASAGSCLLVLDYFNYFSFLSIFTNLLIAPFIFAFYTINFIFFLSFLFFHSFIFLDLHFFIYQFISFFIEFLSDLTTRFPLFKGLSFELNGLLHFLLFSVVLGLCCFPTKYKHRVFLVSLYYFIIWVFCFCSSF